MAPEFFPFFLVTALAAALVFSLTALVGSTILAVFVPRLRPYLKIMCGISGAAVISMGTVLFFFERGVYTQFFLNEPMVSAAAQGDLPKVRQFLDRGASPDAYGIDYVETALIAAVRSGREDIVALLISRGANPGLRDFQGATALDHATKAGQGGIVRRLEIASDLNEKRPNKSLEPTPTAVTPRATESKSK